MLQGPKDQPRVAAALFGEQCVLPLAADLTSTTTYSCDAPFGRRIYKSSSSGTSIFAYDIDNLVEETNAAGTVVARYSQNLDIDEPLAMLRSSTTSYYHADGLGSVTSLSNGSGSPAQTYGYDSFGKQINSSGSLTNPFQYTAREFDSETNLYYYRARYYDPVGGRFISEDPLRLNGGDVNFYVYVRNDSNSLIDPFGLRPGDKYPSARCAGWNAENDYNPKSRKQNREYGGFLYKNNDGTYSYTDPSADHNAGVGTADAIPNFWNITIPAGTQRAGWFHTHAAFDPGMNGPGNPAPGQPGYNPNHDGNEIFSPDDKHISDIDLHGLPGILGTPRGMVKEYIPIPGHPGHGRVGVVNHENCDCGGQ
jgi:RHS repeat-associated protein